MFLVILDAAAALVSGQASQPVAQHCVEIISNRDLLRVFLRWLDEGGAPDPDSDDEGEGMCDTEWARQNTIMHEW